MRRLPDHRSRCPQGQLAQLKARLHCPVGRSGLLYKGIVNYDALDAYRNFGGIRLEDDILVTEDGCRFIGDKKIPITVEELEAVVGK